MSTKNVSSTIKARLPSYKQKVPTCNHDRVCKSPRFNSQLNQFFSSDFMLQYQNTLMVILKFGCKTYTSLRRLMTESNCLNIVLTTTIFTQVSHYLIHLNVSLTESNEVQELGISRTYSEKTLIDGTHSSAICL